MGITDLLNRWKNCDTFGKVLISMYLLAIVGLVVFCTRYEMIGIIIIWSSVTVDIIALVVVAIRRRVQINEDI